MRALESQSVKALQERTAWAHALAAPPEARPVDATKFVQRIKPLRDEAVWSKMQAALDVGRTGLPYRPLMCFQE